MSKLTTIFVLIATVAMAFFTPAVPINAQSVLLNSSEDIVFTQQSTLAVSDFSVCCGQNEKYQYNPTVLDSESEEEELFSSDFQVNAIFSENFYYEEEIEDEYYYEADVEKLGLGLDRLKKYKK